MLQDIDKTMENLIYQYGNLNRQSIEISFELPNREWSARLSRPTVSCWCFNIRENMKLREPHLNTEYNGNIARYVRPAKRIDITYLVTAWARKIEDEHQLIWRALTALKRFQRLDPAECEGDLRYQQRPLPNMVATEGEHPVNLADIWSVIDNDMRVGFTAVLTVEMDLDLVTETPLVLEGIVRIGQSERPQDQELQVQDVELKHTPDDVPDKNPNSPE